MRPAQRTDQTCRFQLHKIMLCHNKEMVSLSNLNDAESATNDGCT